MLPSLRFNSIGNSACDRVGKHHVGVEHSVEVAGPVGSHGGIAKRTREQRLAQPVVRRQATKVQERILFARRVKKRFQTARNRSLQCYRPHPWIAKGSLICGEANRIHGIPEFLTNVPIVV